MLSMRQLVVALVMLLIMAGSTFAVDPSWPKELIFALLSTESAPEVGWRWTPVLDLLSKDLGITVKQVAAVDYRGSILIRPRLGSWGQRATSKPQTIITPIRNPSRNCNTPTAPLVPIVPDRPC